MITGCLWTKSVCATRVPVLKRLFLKLVLVERISHTRSRPCLASSHTRLFCETHFFFVQWCVCSRGRGRFWRRGAADAQCSKIISKCFNPKRYTRWQREAAEADGKAMRTLEKLKLFREFYIMVRDDLFVSVPFEVSLFVSNHENCWIQIKSRNLGCPSKSWNSSASSASWYAMTPPAYDQDCWIQIKSRNLISQNVWIKWF